jgi:hypothetical protein
MNLRHPADPWKPIRIATSLCVVLGLFLLVIALVAGALVYRAGLPAFGGMLFYGALGAAYWFLGIQINRLRAWAAITALCLTSMALLIALFALALGFWMFVGSIRSEAAVLIMTGALCVIELVIVFALGLLIFELALALRSCRIILEQRQVGFEVLPMVTPVEQLIEPEEHAVDCL